MPVNILGGTMDLAAGQVPTEIPIFSQNQYNPVPWDTQLVIIARAWDPNNVSNLAPGVYINLNIKGDQIAQQMQVPDGQFSVLYSQMLRREVMAGQRWELLFGNMSGIALSVEANLYFYHADSDGNWDEMPQLFV